MIFYELFYCFMDFHQIRNSTKFIKFSLKNNHKIFVKFSKNHNIFFFYIFTMSRFVKNNKLITNFMKIL